MIDKIHIKNFKSITEMQVICNSGFNIIIGENNIGKTTIFEALHLWKICYDASIQKRDKKRFYSMPKNINFSDNEFLRIYEDRDLLNKQLYAQNKDITITLTINFNDNSYDLGFVITKVAGLDNAYLQVSYVDKNAFADFASSLNGSQYNLATVVVICESRPIANIVAKEPYMFKSQITDKISRGKGYEVLRNKILKAQNQVARHISNVMGYECKFNEVDKDNKTYIRLMVNGTNILSQGSGFLQIAEIFSSLEYVDAGMFVLLIDEPDAHLHMALQKNLINELREIPNSQTFIITHNESFLNYIPDNEILFIDAKRKEAGQVAPIPNGFKNLILKDLVGTIERIDELRTAEKIVLCEGDTDVDFLKNLLEKYISFNNIEIPSLFIDRIFGIDTLNDKLLSYSRAYRDFVQDTAKWIVIRDSDCLPISRQSSSRKKNKEYITASNKDIIFQKGYGIESTFLTEKTKLASLLVKYYELDGANCEADLTNIINETIESYAININVVTHELHIMLERHFKRQKSKRDEYRDLEFRHMLSEINQDNIEYIMTKDILNKFLLAVHDKVVQNYSNIQSNALNKDTLISFYFEKLNCMNDMYECHKELIEKLIN